MIVDVGRKADQADQATLSLCGNFLRQLKARIYATEIYRKMGDVSSVVELQIEAEDWEEAFSSAEKYPQFKEMVYVKYATSLAETDQFLLAQKAFHAAGKPAEALRVLQELTNNAVTEHRFDDAAYYYWMLSLQCLDHTRKNDSDDSNNEIDPEEAMQKYHDYQRKSSMYYVYHTIQRYMDEPFTSYMPEALFNISRFLLHELAVVHPPGISEFATMYTLAKQVKYW